MSNINIPEYYKQFQTGQKPGEKKETDKPQDIEQLPKPVQKPGTEKQKQATLEKDKTIVYQGNGFTINQLEDWKDSTLYTLTGPVTDGMQHNIIIVKDKDVPIDYLIDYSEIQIQALIKELKGCMILKKGVTKLLNEMDAYEVIYSWIPAEGIKIYQHQIYVLVEKSGYKITASFTKKTLYSLGPQVERMMLSFNPSAEPKK